MCMNYYEPPNISAQRLEMGERREIKQKEMI